MAIHLCVNNHINTTQENYMFQFFYLADYSNGLTPYTGIYANGVQGSVNLNTVNSALNSLSTPLNNIHVALAAKQNNTYNINEPDVWAEYSTTGYFQTDKGFAKVFRSTPNTYMPANGSGFNIPLSDGTTFNPNISDYANNAQLYITLHVVAPNTQITTNQDVETYLHNNFYNYPVYNYVFDNVTANIWYSGLHTGKLAFWCATNCLMTNDFDLQVYGAVSTNGSADLTKPIHTDLLLYKNFNTNKNLDYPSFNNQGTPTTKLSFEQNNIKALNTDYNDFVLVHVTKGIAPSAKFITGTHDNATIKLTPENPKIGDHVQIDIIPNSGFVAGDPNIDKDYSQLVYYKTEDDYKNGKYSGATNFRTYAETVDPNTSRMGAILDDFTLSASGVYVINAVVVPALYKINNQLKHGKIYDKNTGEEITELRGDNSYTLEIKADGYEFSDLQLISNSANSPVGTINGNTIIINKIDTSDNETWDRTQGLTLTGTETLIPTQEYTKIINNNPNFTVNTDTVPTGKETTLVLTTKQGYIFKAKDNNPTLADGYIIIDGSQNSLTLSNSNTTATITVKPTTTQDITFNLNVVEKTIPEDQRKQIPITLNLTNCSSDISSLPEENNNNYITKTITLTAKNGYIFNDDVIVYSYQTTTNQYEKTIVTATKTSSITFNMIGGTYANYDKTKIGLYPSITATATIQEQPVQKGLDSIHLYNMTDGELDNLSDKIVSYISDNNIQTYDYTRFINQVYRLPFEIPKNIQVPTNAVKTGQVNFQLATTALTNENYDINVGSIDCTGINKNSLDYDSLKATLILPFINNINLDINDIIDNTINIIYRINLLNGKLTVVINNNSGNLITQLTNVATNLQIFGTYEDKDVGSLNSVLNNQIRQAYLIISYNEPITNLSTYECNEHGKLKDYHGLTKATNIQLDNNCNYSEENEIRNILQNGVIIK